MRLSDAEWTVMQALWESSPATAREVLERTSPGTGWAYTTVKTMLTRLVEKGVLQEKKSGKACQYAPLLSQDAARGSALRSLVERAFDGRFGSLLHHMVREERLSKADQAELNRLLDEAEDGQ